MDLVAFPNLTPEQMATAASILRLAIHGPSYKAPGEAEEEAQSFVTDPERFAIAAIRAGDVVGWVGGIRGYSHALELHPLVVDPAHQREGVGAVLTQALEVAAAAEGYLTLHLGTDDDYAGTNLFGADLFPDPLAKLAQIAPTADGHAYFFYLKQGFVPTGVLPDANGPGKPDILMSKRVGLVARNLGL